MLYQNYINISKISPLNAPQHNQNTLWLKGTQNIFVVWVPKEIQQERGRERDKNVACVYVIRGHDALRYGTFSLQSTLLVWDSDY